MMDRCGRLRYLLFSLQLSEVLFNFLVTRKLAPVLPYGDILLFSAGLAGHSFILKYVEDKIG